MSAIDEETAAEAPQRQSDPARFIEAVGSVKFGIVLLLTLVSISVAGMLIPQYNVSGFDQYLATLDPFTRRLFSTLGLFDVYGSWYFRGLLMLLTTNILLSSVDHFPNAWKLIRHPKTTPSDRWIRSQVPHAGFETGKPPEQTAEAIAEACRRLGFRRIRISEKDGKHFVFAESGAWNRLGAYAVHAALITILAGGFITSQFSYSGRMQLSVGETTDRIDEIVFQDDLPSIRYRRVPFLVKCLDLEQKLIDRRGPLESSNSIDWLTTIEIDDGSGKTRAVVHLNEPFSYRGFRFFHSTFQPIGKARSIRITVESPAGPQTVSIGRGETAALADGTALRFVDFRANLSLQRGITNENSTDYRNPAAVLEARLPSGETRTVIAVRDNQPGENPAGIEGFSFRLIDFEKVSERHEMVVRYDPGAPIVYFGSAFLVVSLLAVFLFSHRRVWVSVAPAASGRSSVVAGGNANRNPESLDARFQKLVSLVQRS